MQNMARGTIIGKGGNMKENIERQCVDCSKTFVIEPGEVAFYENKGLDLPKRCAECRAKRKAENGHNTFNETSSSTKPKKSLEEMLAEAGIGNQQKY